MIRACSLLIRFAVAAAAAVIKFCAAAIELLSISATQHFSKRAKALNRQEAENAKLKEKELHCKLCRFRGGGKTKLFLQIPRFGSKAD